MSKQLRLPTLLVVAESPKIRFWIKKHLDENFFVISAENRQEAIQAMASSLDFVIVDSELEGCDALELCADIRKMTNTLLPIFLITGRLKKSYRDLAKESGISDFLSDQLDLNELMAKIEKGKKSASIVNKTVGISQSIQELRPNSPSSSLKDKVILSASALKLLREAKKEHLSVALLLLRIDHFEEFENGPEIFKSLSSFIQKLLRAKDVLITSTEGKLILLLAGTTPESGKIVASRLREKIAKHPFSQSKPLTVSIAVSSLEASEKSFSKTISSATKSLKLHSDSNLIIPLDEEAL